MVWYELPQRQIHNLKLNQTRIKSPQKEFGSALGIKHIYNNMNRHLRFHYVKKIGGNLFVEITTRHPIEKKPRVKAWLRPKIRLGSEQMIRKIKIGRIGRGQRITYGLRDQKQRAWKIQPPQIILHLLWWEKRRISLVCSISPIMARPTRLENNGLQILSTPLSSTHLARAMGPTIFKRVSVFADITK